MTDIDPWCRVEENGTRLIVKVHVQPGARRTETSGLHGGMLKIRLAAPPVDGKANSELIRFVAAAFGVPLRAVAIVAGAASRHKEVEIVHPLNAPESLLADRQR
jgi:uncharacterized protein (TIGR00251 family)